MTNVEFVDVVIHLHNIEQQKIPPYDTKLNDSTKLEVSTLTSTTLYFSSWHKIS